MISDSNKIWKLVIFGLLSSVLIFLHQVWKLIYLCHVICKNFQMALLSLQKTCLDRLIWPHCFKYSRVFCFLLSLTSNKDISTVLLIIFSHPYTDCVEAFIFFIEMRKCQCCPISTPMCFYPF